MYNSIQKVEYGTKSIEYNLSFAQRKSLGIKVLPNGDVHVHAPIESNLIDINNKVKSKASWIIKQQSFFKSYQPHTPERKFINGETHLYLGRQYQLRIIIDNINEIKLYRGMMILKSKKNDPIYIKKILDNWYKDKAHKLFNDLLKNLIERFNKYQITKPMLEIRQMNKRWGSCTKTGKILLNTELIKAAKGCIEYVIVHEICHLVYHNHNKSFYELQNVQFPNWEKWKEKLEKGLS